MSFLKCPSIRLVDYAEIIHRLWDIFCVIVDIKTDPVRSHSYDVIRGTASDRFFKGIVFPATSLAAINMKGDLMHDLD